MSVRVTIPLRIESPNAWARMHPGQRFRATKTEREAARKACAHHDETLADMLAQGPLRITLTRIAPGRLDDDNLAFAFKRVRDGVAEAIGVDDGDPWLAWSYGQRRAGAGARQTLDGFGVEIVVSPRGAA